MLVWGDENAEGPPPTKAFGLTNGGGADVRFKSMDGTTITLTETVQENGAVTVNFVNPVYKVELDASSVTNNQLSAKTLDKNLNNGVGGMPNGWSLFVNLAEVTKITTDATHAAIEFNVARSFVAGEKIDLAHFSSTNGLDKFNGTFAITSVESATKLRSHCPLVQQPTQRQRSGGPIFTNIHSGL